MLLRDLTLEVRDRDLQRLGQVTGRFLNLQARKRWCGVGEWTLTLPGDHAMVPHLMEKGSGIVLTGPVGSVFHPRTPTVEPYYQPVYGTILSGPTITPTRLRNRENPDGTFTFKGVTDEVLLQGALAFPSPEVEDPAAQTRANDTRTGSTEDLMREFVEANIVPGVAPAGRIRGLRDYMVLGGVGGGRGLVQAKSPRFQNLLELLQEMNAYDPALGFEVVQVDDLLEFRVVEAGDKRGVVRLDVENGTITSEEVATSGPVVTEAIVAGQGDGTARTIISRRTADATAAESDYGLVWETFIDQRNTNDPVELTQSGDEALAEGAGGTAVKMVPSDDSTMQFGLHWVTGDLLTTVVLGKETTARATEAVIMANQDGVMVGAAIGDVSGFTQQSAQAATVQSLDERVSNLERASAGPGSEWGWKAFPTSHTGAPGGAHANTWQRGSDSGGSIDAHTEPLGVLIKETGIYHVTSRQRQVDASTGYIAVGLNGDRYALDSTSRDGAFDHDHAKDADSFSHSSYFGVLNAGDLVTSGPAAGTGASFLYNQNYAGTLLVRRVS